MVGNVSMDMLTIDVTDVPQAGLGSRVVFWGRELSVNEAAASFDTIGYELLCAVAKRVAPGIFPSNAPAAVTLLIFNIFSILRCNR